MDNEFKWLMIMFCAMFVVFAVGIAGDAYVSSITKPELQKLQQECVELGYGTYQNNKFILKERACP